MRALCLSQDLVQVQSPPLPVELLLQIAANLEDTKNLLSLSYASKVLKEVAYAQIYTSLTITIGDPLQVDVESRWLDEKGLRLLRRTLNDPQIAAIVTRLELRILGCDQTHEPTPRLPARSCGCDRRDAVLGEVLQSLKNLHTLHFQCMLFCWKSVEPHHLYLESLPVKSLGEMVYNCSCTARPTNRPKQTLSASFMQSITSLEWGGTTVFELEETCLPNLSRLACERYKSFLPLIKERPITHLVCDVDYGLHDIIRGRGTPILFLSTKNEGIDLRVLREDYMPYAYLRHVGRFVFHGLSVSFFFLIGACAARGY